MLFSLDQSTFTKETREASQHLPNIYQESKWFSQYLQTKRPRPGKQGPHATETKLVMFASLLTGSPVKGHWNYIAPQLCDSIVRGRSSPKQMLCACANTTETHRLKRWSDIYERRHRRRLWPPCEKHTSCTRKGGTRTMYHRRVSAIRVPAPPPLAEQRARLAPKTAPAESWHSSYLR